MVCNWFEASGFFSFNFFNLIQGIELKTVRSGNSIHFPSGKLE